MIPRQVIMIEGPDAEKALAELLSNAQFDKLDCLIWVSDKPDYDEIQQCTLAYSTASPIHQE